MEEFETWVRELEGEGRVEEVYGSGLQLLPLEPDFVLKTYAAGTQDKVFINVCTCPKVRVPPLQRGNFGALLALHAGQYACSLASQA